MPKKIKILKSFNPATMLRKAAADTQGRPVIATIVIFLIIGIFGLWQTDREKGLLRSPYGLMYQDQAASYRGYTLLTPRRSDTVYLLDRNGSVAHQWKIPGLPTEEEIYKKPELARSGVLEAKLLPNGNLLAGHGIESERRNAPENSSLPFKISGSMPVLKELDWDGNVVWEYKNDFMHHNFFRFPDGRTAVIVLEEAPPDFANKIKGGTVADKKQLFTDAIIEIDKNGKELWRWSAQKNLDPALTENHFDNSVTRDIWPYINSLQYVQWNTAAENPSYLITMSKLDSVAFIERESGKIAWRWGSGILAGPHSATLTEKGNILVFDNGNWRSHFPKSRGILPGAYFQPASRIVEMDPIDGRMSYFSPGPLTTQGIFYTSFNGTVQGLPNGNILVSAGVKGRVFEINKKKNKVVWDYINPLGESIEEWPGAVDNSVSSAYRYPESYAPILK